MSAEATDIMSPATREILGKVRQMVPPMLETFHKGQLGRVAVIGGSEDYTGAPYFSAMASARLGCDMVRTWYLFLHVALLRAMIHRGAGLEATTS